MGKAGRPTTLTAKQELFAREYSVDLNATAAATRAGYQDPAAAGSKLLQKPEIRAIVEKVKVKQYGRIDLNADNVMRELSRIGFLDPGGLFDMNGVMLPLHEIPEDIRRAIASVEVQTVYAGTGVSRVEIGRAMKIKFWSKVEALETLGKHFKLWTDRLEISGRLDVADALKKARERRVQRALAAPATKKPEGKAT